MPDWLTWGLAVVGLLGGSGGIAAYLRARGQNRNDERSQLTTEQIAFRQALAVELTALRAQVAELDKSKDGLEAQTAEQGKQIAVLTRENEYQARDMKAQAEQIGVLHDQDAKKTSQIEKLTEENASTTQQLKIEIAKNNFLEKENNELRREVERLKKQKPARVEVN
jgi:chromosome segregation ATPase